MRLVVEPPPDLPLFMEDLELVVVVTTAGMPELHVPPSQPRPDRHLLLGLAQAALFAVQEKDPESVATPEHGRVTLERDGELKTLGPGLIIVRTVDGKFGVLLADEGSTARKLAREALRHFTGAIRLDVP